MNPFEIIKAAREAKNDLGVQVELSAKTVDGYKRLTRKL